MEISNTTRGNIIRRRILGATLGALIVFVLSFQALYISIAQTGGSNVDARRAELEAELEILEDQIEEQRDLLRGKERESVSLERDLSILEVQIDKKRLEVRARTIAIANLGSDIGEKGQLITQLANQIEKDKQSLAAFLRKTQELDSFSLLEILLKHENIADFFSEIDSFEFLQQELKRSFNELRENKDRTETEKGKLEVQQDEELFLRSIQRQEQARIQENEDEKENLLEITRGEEDVYKGIISVKERSAAEIRSELFELRGTAAIPFGEALDIANKVGKTTGIRPAFLLGLIAEESNLGENVGTGNWLEDMHPDRDQIVFAVIAKTLGLNPDTLPVSKKPWYGWGGAMGPAQFIPTTWACYGGYINTSIGKCGRNPDRSYDGPWIYDENQDRIRIMIGKSSPSSPWEPLDALTASATLLMDNGGSGGQYADERLAALRYFAGWGGASNPAYSFYADDIVGTYPGDPNSLAGKYQGLIDILESSN